MAIFTTLITATKLLVKNMAKKKLKEKEISSDEDKRFQEEIQKLTNANIKNVDSCLVVKEQEIMTV